MTDHPLRAHVATAITDLAAIPDPIARELAARDILAALADGLQDAKAARQQAVTELRQGRTLAQVGALMGGLSAARVDQILKGK